MAARAPMARARVWSDRRFSWAVGEVLRPLGDRIAEALELARRLHHVHERALDSPRQLLVIDRLAAQRTAPVDRLRLEEPFRFPDQRRARQKPRPLRRDEGIPAFEHARVERLGCSAS